MEKLIEQQMVTAAKVVEEQLDAELEQLERIDLNDIDELRRKRLQELKQQAAKKEEWLSQGHSEYSEISEEKEFFEVCKRSERVICHFYRDSTFRCKIVDKHLGLLAKKHIEAKFIKLNVDRAPFLVQRLKIKVLPTLALVKEAKTKDYIIGFDDLGGHDEFSTEMLEWRIARAGLLDYNGDLLNPPDSRKKPIVHGQTKKTIRSAKNDSSDDEDD